MNSNRKSHLLKSIIKRIGNYLPPVPEKWVEYFAWVGLVAKGLVYSLVGILAFLTAFELGTGIREGGKRKVFIFIEDLILGKILLGVVAIGLACYSVWRLMQAIYDTENKGIELKGLATRMRYGASGVFYGSVVFLAAKLIAGFDSDKDSFRQAFTKAVLEMPFGQIIVLIIAIVIALSGAYLIYVGISGKYKQRIKEAGEKHQFEVVIISVGKIGYIARGLVRIIISYLVLRVALHIKSGDAENAFRFLESFYAGSFLLATIALGLICYGLFVFMEARFRQGKN